jgi:hypothetical protein
MNLIEFENQLKAAVAAGHIAKEDEPKVREEYAKERMQNALKEYNAKLQPVPGVYGNENPPANRVQDPAPLPFLPPWGWDSWDGKINALGMLFLRLTWRTDLQQGMSYSTGKGKFNVGSITVVDVVVAGDTAFVYLFIEGRGPLVVTDEIGLFPSDSLLTKLATIQE